MAKKNEAEKARSEVLSLWGDDLDAWKRRANYRTGDFGAKEERDNPGDPATFRGWVTERDRLKKAGLLPDLSNPKEIAAFKELKKMADYEGVPLWVFADLNSATNPFSVDSMSTIPSRRGKSHQDLLDYEKRAYITSEELGPELFEDYSRASAGSRSNPYDYLSPRVRYKQGEHDPFGAEWDRRHGQHGFTRDPVEQAAESSAYGLDESRPYHLRATFPEDTGAPDPEISTQMDKLRILAPQKDRPVHESGSGYGKTTVDDMRKSDGRLKYKDVTISGDYLNPLTDSLQAIGGDPSHPLNALSNRLTDTIGNYIKEEAAKGTPSGAIAPVSSSWHDVGRMNESGSLAPREVEWGRSERSLVGDKIDMLRALLKRQIEQGK